MPEGDTVYRQAAALRSALAGQQLVTSDFRVPRYATVDLSGETVDSVGSRGKHLLIRAGGLTIQSHLRMEGTWHVYARESGVGGRSGSFPRWRRTAHTARCVLTTADRQAVGFSLGELHVMRESEEAAFLAHLGPDLLGPDWDPDEAYRRLTSEPDRSIGVALLDQRNLAGVGNVFRSEICFLAGVHPGLSVAEVEAGAGTVHRVLDLSQRLLEINKSRTLRSTTGIANPRSALWVYGRRGQACLRCRTRIARAELGEPELRRRAVQDRVIYFCPSCQPDPAS